MSRDWLEVHPDDATRSGCARARRSRCAAAAARSSCRAQITPRIEPGHVFTAFHFPEVRTNLLIGQSADVNTSCPEYKVVAVAIEPAGDRVSQPRAAEPARRLGTGQCSSRSRVDGGTDEVAVELPLEIRLNGSPVAVTMRTPGHDFELAARLPLRRGDRVGRAGDDAARGPGGEHRGRRRAGRRRARDAALLHDLVLRDLRQGRARGGRGDRAGRCRAGRRSRARCWRSCRIACASRPSSAPAGCTRPGCSRRGRAAAGARGRGSPQRDGQGVGRALLEDALPLGEPRALRERPARVRAGAEGGAGRARRSWSASAPRPRSRSSWPRTAGSRWPASPAAGG